MYMPPGTRLQLDPKDEYTHAPEAAGNYNESMYFNVYDPAERVVAGARALSPHLGERMIAAKLLGKSVFIRELAPQDLKLEVEQFTEAQAVKAARYLSYVVGTAHARQMDASARASWRRSLLDHRGTGIEAPSWLWQAIVDLSGSHEAGYLEHCRRYALAGASA